MRGDNWGKRGGGRGNSSPCKTQPTVGKPPFTDSWKGLLCLLSRKILCIFFSYLPGNFALKNGGDFRWIFFWFPFPTKWSTKTPQKFQGNSEQNSGQNPGQKFGNFRSAIFWPKKGTSARNCTRTFLILRTNSSRMVYTKGSCDNTPSKKGS